MLENSQMYYKLLCYAIELLPKFSENLAEFRDMTYSYDEIFGGIVPNVSQGMKVKEIATFVYGRCFVFEVSVLESH